MTQATLLEESMRPGRLSSDGFLGHNENLADVVAADEETVRRLGVTHEQLAARLEHFLEASMLSKAFDHGTYRVRVQSWRGIQECPWDRKYPFGSVDASIENLETKETLSYPGLIVHLIRAHHFYEGKESPYRVDPERIVRVLGVQ